ncbi:MAG: AAA family ATPase [Deltaproteobacteria bacterium]|nr:AAA family ATPase [Deltaproteobacteria bacterium]
MYQEFYGLKEKPFALTPDPQFLYLSEGHRTAIDSLIYGIDQREGFMVLTGDIGTGKTTICRALLEKLDKKIKTAVIFNSFLTEGDLLKAILRDLGCPSNGRSKKERIDVLNQFLVYELSQGANVALIIDEAQNLSTFVLEQIRMLSNLETEKEKMLQIVLIGQRELEKKLQSSSLRQLNQRIAIRHRLLPLTLNETESYIQQRLTVGGAQGNLTFSRAALQEIYKFSRGIPRLINLLCDRTLLAGFVEQTYHIHKGTVKKAEKSLSGREVDTTFTNLWAFLCRSIPLPMALLTIFFSLSASIMLSSPKAKDFIWAKVQGVYWQISGGPEQPALKIGEKGAGKDSREVSRGGQKA